MTLIVESKLRQIIREAIEATASDEAALLSAGFDDIQQGLAIARRKAAGKSMGFVKDVDGFYAYAAIGGNLEVGPQYAPDMFVVIHDGLRPDRKSLGAVFRPSDKPPEADRFLAYSEQSRPMGDPQFKAHVLDIAQKLTDAYAGGNSYDFLVRSIRARVLPAGSAQEVAQQDAPAASEDQPPAAPASSPSAADAMAAVVGAAVEQEAKQPRQPGKKPKLPKIDLSKIFGFFKIGKRPQKDPPSPSTPRTPGGAPERVARSDKEAGRRAREQAPPGGAARAGRSDRSSLPDPQYSAKAWNEAWSQLNPTERAIALGALTGNRSIQKLREMIAKAIDDGTLSDYKLRELVMAGVPQGTVPAKGLGVNKGAAQRVIYDVRFGPGGPEYGTLAYVERRAAREKNSPLGLYPVTAALLIEASNEHGDREVTVDNVNLKSTK